MLPAGPGGVDAGLDGTVTVTEIDWKVLRAGAVEVAAHAYARYSGLSVGAAALTDKGEIVRGCNVENVSFGLTLCAECVLVGNLFTSGGGRLTALSCSDSAGRPLMPCGRCRQVLHEHGGAELLIDAADGPVRLGDLLPAAFGPADLPTATAADDGTVGGDAADWSGHA